MITTYVQRIGQDGPLRVPSVPTAVAASFRALGETERATLVRELGLAAKTLVMSPTFLTAYTAYLKDAHNAVDHGLKIEDHAKTLEAALKSGNTDAMEAASNKMMRDNFRRQVEERLPEIAKFTQQQIEIMAEVDAGMADMAMPTTAAEKASVAKAKAMLAESRKLASSDLAKARETYGAALKLAAGLKSEADAAAGRDLAARQDQQRNYDRLALKPNLKRGLEDFLTLARGVNFNAPTTQKGGKTVFVNSADERRSELWKMLYRVGPAGCAAAVSVAQGWLKEL
ncbi:MAG: hypothetical protein KJZ84_17095 [Bryobacteraceae bacterium]|nr:hypothetical protein [Bryobacteraceae bacterium]